MSMLAGPRRKQKWTLNPRGKQWSEDSSKYGQKILEKMGWSSGKGLGAQEQGMVEHIRVKVKNDQVGIGYDKNRDDHWTEHQDNFNDLLKKLQNEQTDDTDVAMEDKDKVLSGKSLEEKSKLSQKRVHYKKFTRGKDVNKYSMKDLANIFGKRDLDEKIPEKVSEEQEEIVHDPVGAKDTTAGILTIKGGNINDYFRKKFKMSVQSPPLEQNECSDLETGKTNGISYGDKSRSKFYINDITCSNKQSSDNESEERLGFGFKKGGMSTFYVSDGTCTNDEVPNHQTGKTSNVELTKKSSKKSKNKKSDDLNYVFDNPCLDLNILDSPQPRKIKKEQTQNQITPKKRTNEFIYENEGLDKECLDDEPVPKKRRSDLLCVETHLDNSTKLTPKNFRDIKNQSLGNNESFLPELEVIRKSTPKKFKKKKKNDPTGLENPALDIDSFDSVNPYEVRRESNNEVQRNVYENPGLELEDSDELTSKMMETECSTESSCNAYSNPALAIESLEQEVSNKSINESIVAGMASVYVNPAFNLDNTDSPNHKKTKKEKRSNAASDKNANLQTSYENFRSSSKDEYSIECEILPHEKKNSISLQESADEPTPKKKKKSKLTSHGLENPALDLDILENESKVSTGFEIVKFDSGLENVGLDLSDEDVKKKRVTFNDEIEYNTDIIKKKKKKKMKKLDKYEVVTSKLKRNSELMEPVAFVNEALDIQILNEEQIDNELNEIKSKKSRRKKNRRLSTLETIQEAPEEEEISIVETRVRNSDNDIEIVGEFTQGDEPEIMDSASKVEHKKNKKKRNIIAKNASNHELGDEIIEEIDISEEVITSKKSKKIKSTQDFLQDAGTYSQLNNSEKENDCRTEYTNKISNKRKGKKKKPSHEDVMSLEEFLNEDSVSKIKARGTKSSTDSVAEKGKNRKSGSNTFENDSPQCTSQKHQKPKHVMKSLFIKNPTLMFNGSNINEIKGYGSQISHHFH